MIHLKSNELNQTFKTSNERTALKAVLFVAILSLTNLLFSSAEKSTIPPMNFELTFQLEKDLDSLTIEAQKLNQTWESLPTIKTEKDLKKKINPIFKEMHAIVKMHSPVDEDALWVAETDTRIRFIDMHRLIRDGLNLEFFNNHINEILQNNRQIKQAPRKTKKDNE